MDCHPVSTFVEGATELRPTESVSARRDTQPAAASSTQEVPCWVEGAEAISVSLYADPQGTLGQVFAA